MAGDKETKDRKKRALSVNGKRVNFSGPMEEKFAELERRYKTVNAELKSARREKQKYIRLLETSKNKLPRKHQQLQDKVHLKERQLSEKVKRLSILYEVGRVMAATLDLDHLLNLIVKLAARHLKARKASLMLIDETGRRMKINSSVGIQAWIVEKTRIKLGEGISGEVAATGEAVFIEDISTDKRFGRLNRSTYQTGSFLSAPLKCREKILGVLNISDKQSMEPFDEEDLHLVKTLAAEAAISVENATLYQHLQDKITSLENLSHIRETERQQLLTLINSMTDGILAVGLRGELLFVNSKARKFLSLPEGEKHNRPLKDILQQGELEVGVLKGIKSALAKTATRQEITLVQNSGARKYFELISLPIKKSPDTMIGGLTIIRDSTEFKELDQSRSDFLNRASHQLKTPIGLIKGFADTLTRHPELDSGHREHFLNLVQSEANRLAELIENLLDFSQLESRMLRVELEQVEIREIFKKLLPAIEMKAAEKNIDIKTSLAAELPIIATDPSCLMEVVRNVLDNSLKFTPRGGRVWLSARKAEGCVEVAVKDNGIGIDESEIPYIFDKFYVGRLTGASGTGLGLYIAKEMIDSLGGSLGVTSSPGKGTVVAITLPLPGKGRNRSSCNSVNNKAAPGFGK